MKQSLELAQNANKGIVFEDNKQNAELTQNVFVNLVSTHAATKGLVKLARQVALASLSWIVSSNSALAPSATLESVKKVPAVQATTSAPNNLDLVQHVMAENA